MVIVIYIYDICYVYIYLCYLLLDMFTKELYYLISAFIQLVSVWCNVCYMYG